jgi:uncharacterized membrane protein
LSGAAFIAYPIAVYVGLTHFSIRWAALGLLVLIAPLALSRLARARRESAGTIALIPVLTFVLLGVSALLNRSGFVLAIPVVINGVLLATFGPTLLRAFGPPMIERFARLQDPDLGPKQILWCRLWTWIWCGFFVVNGVPAAVLAIAAPLEWWTLYTGLLAYGLMGVLGGTEWVLRKLFIVREPTPTEGSA